MPKQPPPSRRLHPDDLITAPALDDFGYHQGLGRMIVKGELYTVRAAEFPLQLLERPAGVVFPFEAAPAADATNTTEGGD